MGSSERRGSIVGERRSSIVGTIGGPDHSRFTARSSRAIAPIHTNRSARPSLLVSSLGASTRETHGGLEQLLDAENERPSPTAMRLRSLARSVRAVNKLGSLKVRKRYLASAPMASVGTTAQSSDDDQRSGIGIAVANPQTARVIVLPTNEFSTVEMKYRLDPLEPPSGATLNVHGVLDMLTSNGAPPNGRPTSASTNQGSKTKLERSGSTASLAPPVATSREGDGAAKMRWKNAAVRSTSTSVPQGTSPVLRHGQSHSAGPRHTKRGSSSSFSPENPFISSSQGDELSSTGTGASNLNIEARLCCARSLYKLSCQEGCELSIIQGGAISQLAEFSDVDHRQVHELCAATLANLTVESSAMDAFVALGGIPALLELSWSPSVSVKLMCATALCRLSSRPAHAAALARSRASIEFISMMSLPSEQLQKLAISSIVNLIYFGHSFPDRIFLGEPHAIQNQLGILTITSQLAMSNQTMQFAAEVLFNLALYRTSCSGALRGGGAEILHGLAVHVGKALDEHHYSGSSNNISQQQTPRLSLASAMNLLKLIAHTLANFSAHVEYQSMMSGPAMKSLSLMLFGALRDLGSRFYGGVAEERLRILATPCSRALANFSSSEEQRKDAFIPEMVQLTTRLFLVNRTKLFLLSSGNNLTQDEQSFARNILRAIANLSFHEGCAAHLMEFTDVMPRLAKVVLRSKDDPIEEDELGNETSSSDDDYDEYEGGDGDTRASKSRSPQESASPGDMLNHTGGSLADQREQMREDALVAILNLAQQGAYSHELLKNLDGKQLARAAEEQENGTRLKYVYDVVLCNMLFESRLQQIVYGDLVLNALIDGYYFFSSQRVCDDPFTTDTNSCVDAESFMGWNLAFPNDQERFLAAIVTIAGELLDVRNIERLVTLALDCIRPMESSMAPAQRKRRRHLACYGSAILYTLARSSATRGDAISHIYAANTVQALIDVCEGNAPGESGCATITSGRGGFSYCSFTQAFCAATLYHICSTGHFNSRVIQALICACNANEESLSLLACSAAFAIVSFTTEGREQLVAAENLAMALNRLGRTSQVECQQYAAIAACNVSTLHCIWTSDELKDFIVVALLRANSTQAKHIHAKTLANLLSHIKTRAKAVEDGVLYALMKLSQVTPPSAPHNEASSAHEHSATSSPAVSSRAPDGNDEVFHLGLQVLFNLSYEPQFHQKLMGNGIISYLATAVVSAKQNRGKEPLRPGMASATEPLSMPLSSTVGTESRRFAMGIVCNLSSYEVNHKELMNSQVIEIIRSYVDHDVETRASAAMAVRNLSCRQPWVEMICERRTLQMLISFTHCDHPVVRHFAIQALANCSQVTDSLHLFGELKVTRAVMAVLESIRPSQSPLKVKLPLPTSASLTDSHETSMAALKCLHNVAADDALAQNLMEETAILRLMPIMESRELINCPEACELASSTISVLASKPRCAEPLLRQRVVGFCALLHRKHPENPVVAYECAVIMMKLSTYQPIQNALTETQAIQVVVTVCSSMSACSDPCIRECGAITIRNLTLCVAEHLLVFYDESNFEDELTLAKSKAGQRRRERSTTTDKPSQSAGPETGSTMVSRLSERHLMHGVQYLQQELERLLSDNCSAIEQEDTQLREQILVEACAGIANLSTVKSFRIEMVRTGIVPSLLRLFHVSPNSASIPVPAIARSMCCTTLHRLALEEEATVDGRGLLVPSLLEILHQSDEELHRVRYECEKVSFPSLTQARTRPPKSTADRTPTRLQPRNRAPQSCVVPLSPPLTDAQSGLVATTVCIKQNYREPKWTAYVVKTLLSSVSMVPQLEKKQIRAVGMPKLSFFDSDASNLFATDHSSSDDSAPKRKGGYLLPVHADKFTSFLAACLRDGRSTECTADAITLGAGTARSAVGASGAHDREAMVHTRKFDRHMRLTRRNHRRTNVLPTLSLGLS